MRACAALLMLCLPLLSCGRAQPPQEVRDREIARSDSLPVVGPERQLVVVATGALDGAGLAADERFDTLLQLALRARGVDAKIVIARAGEVSAETPPDLIVAGADASVSGADARVPVFRIDPAQVLSGKPDLFQADGFHPNAQGVEQLVAATGKQLAAMLSTPQAFRP